jgi:hypothetical protein
MKKLLVCALALAGCVTCPTPRCRGVAVGLPFECNNSDDRYRSPNESCSCEVPPVSGHFEQGTLTCH